MRRTFWCGSSRLWVGDGETIFLIIVLLGLCRMSGASGGGSVMIKQDPRLGEGENYMILCYSVCRPPNLGKKTPKQRDCPESEKAM